jgi:hypothetical protein
MGYGNVVGRESGVRSWSSDILTGRVEGEVVSGRSGSR